MEVGTLLCYNKLRGDFMINRICTFYFTGTDTTKKVVEEFAKELGSKLGVDNFFHYNFTTPDARKEMPAFGKGDIVIGGVPTIAGRVPNLLLPYLKTINGEGALGVSISLYGNRNVDDCLVEFRDLMEQGGINVIAGGAFVGEHSFSEILAKGRPDAEDLKIVREFAGKVAEKIKEGDLTKPEMVGEVPYRPYYTPRDRNGKGIDIRKVKPKTDMTLCIDCKLCAEVCPMGAIDFDDVSQVPGICMKCCACIKKCPTGAKYFDDEGYLYHAHELEDMYERRAEPEYFV